MCLRIEGRINSFLDGISPICWLVVLEWAWCFLVWVLDSDRGVWEKGIFFFFVEFSVVLASDFSGLRLDLG